MTKETKARRTAPAGLEAHMRTISLAISAVALTLMIVGFAAAARNGHTAAELGDPVVPLDQLTQATAASWPLAARTASC